MRRIFLIPHYRVPGTPLAFATTYAASAYGVVQGLGIMLSSPERFGSPVFGAVRDHQTLWGGAALTFGVLIFVGLLTRRFVVKGIGLVLLAAWSLVFGSATLNAYLTTPTTSPTGPPTYYFIAIALVILVWMDGRRTVDATIIPPAA